MHTVYAVCACAYVLANWCELKGIKEPERFLFLFGSRCCFWCPAEETQIYKTKRPQPFLPCTRLKDELPMSAQRDRESQGKLYVLSPLGPQKGGHFGMFDRVIFSKVGWRPLLYFGPLLLEFCACHSGIAAGAQPTSLLAPVRRQQEQEEENARLRTL